MALDPVSCGKSIFIWNASSIEGGDPARIAALLVAANFEGAILHATSAAKWHEERRPELVEAVRSAGLKVYGSVAVYGSDPAAEGRAAAGLVEQHNLDGMVIDAETAFDGKLHPADNATDLLQAYKGLTGQPVAWCWWSRYKSPDTGAQWHPVEVLRHAMQLADLGMPMCYWSGSEPTSAELLVTQSFRQWREITSKPLIPVGRAYTGEGGSATGATTTRFERVVRCVLEGAGITWWSMQHAVNLPEVWYALQTSPKWAAPVLPPPGDSPVLHSELQPLIDRIAALEAFKEHIKNA